MHRTTRFACVALVVLATSCYQPAWYKSAQSGDAAQLTIHNGSESIIYPQTFVNHEDCSGGKLILGTTQALAAGANAYARLPPDQVFSFFVTSRPVSGKACFVPGKFVPKAGGQYVIDWAFDPDEQKCLLAVRVLSRGEMILEPSFKEMPWNPPFTESGAFCN
jgi:hypothetical protein